MQLQQIGIAISISVVLVGCARSSSMLLDSRTASITTTAAPICGSDGAQQVAMKNAAIATLRNGFDRYVIRDGMAKSDVRVIGHTPTYGSSYTNGHISVTPGRNTWTGNYSSSTTTQVYGAYPIIAGGHKQSLVVTMFRKGESGYEYGVDARTVLGPDWQKVVTKGKMLTCFE
jgi:hypothetical protein